MRTPDLIDCCLKSERRRRHCLHTQADLLSSMPPLSVDRIASRSGLYRESQRPFIHTPFTPSPLPEIRSSRRETQLKMSLICEAHRHLILLCLSFPNFERCRSRERSLPLPVWIVPPSDHHRTPPSGRAMRPGRICIIIPYWSKLPQWLMYPSPDLSLARHRLISSSHPLSKDEKRPPRTGTGHSPIDRHEVYETTINFPSPNCR